MTTTRTSDVDVFNDMDVLTDVDVLNDLDEDIDVDLLTNDRTENLENELRQ